ncbi:MAG: adenosylcobinamide amidohydrolase [Thermoproteus sp.]
MTLFVLDLGRDLLALGNVVLGGDFEKVRYVVFKQVDRYIADFDLYASTLLESLGLVGRAAVFFTAADISKMRHAEGRLVELYATVGLANPACIGAAHSREGHTVNILVVSRAPLSRRGLLDLYRTAAEAKAATLTARGLCGGRPSLGTTSDAVLVVAPPGGAHYAGAATEIGSETSFLIYEILNKLKVE